MDEKEMTDKAKRVAEDLGITSDDLLVEIWAGIYLADGIAKAIDTQLSNLISGSYDSGHKGIRDYCRELVEHIKRGL